MNSIIAPHPQGAIVEAEMPDGRRLHVAVEEVVHPGFVKVRARVHGAQ